MATAKNRALDQLRRNKLLERKHEEIGREMDEARGARSRCGARRRHRRRSAAAGVHRLPSGAVDRGARRADAAPARRADHRGDRARLLVPEPTIAQRIVRAKRTLARRVPFEVPRGAELAERLSSVLEVIYLVFNEGYAATAGDDWMRPALCEEALRLGRILAELAPRAGGARPRRADGDPGLALARAHGPDGEPVLLLDQNRARWDQLADPPRAGGAGARRGGSAGERALCAAGRDRRLSCARPHRGRDRLGAHRRALRELAERRRRRWSSSIARSRSRWRTGRRRDLRWSMRSPPSRR
jgi:RNA polymerase sigma-70 factor (ECF subfamily)